MYWAEMAKHDLEFEGLAKDLADNESKIIDDLIQCQGTLWTLVATINQTL